VMPDEAEVIPMYCVAAYPAAYADLAVMWDLKQLYDNAGVGFSDHTLGISMAVEACKQGATVLEKHVTFFPDLDTPDRPHSLTPDEFKLMVDVIRGVRRPEIGPSPEEKAMLLRHNRRLIATRDVKPGEVLRYGENFGAFRSLKDDTRGLSPFAWESVEGKRAKGFIARGDGVGPGDFE
jgi:sialic acid synthase SpsE